MKSLSRPIRVILFIDMLLIGLSLIGIYQLMERPAIGGSFLKKEKGVYIRKMTDQTGESLLERNDRVVAIDGKVINSPTEFEFVLDQYKIGDTVSVLIDRAGSKLLIPIKLVPYFSNSYIGIVLAVGLLYIFVAILVLTKRPQDKAAHIFHWACVSVAMIIMLTWGRYTIEPMGAGYLVRIMNTFAYLMCPVLFLHFTLLFPQPQAWGKRMLRSVYVIGIGLAALIAVAFVLASEPLSRISPGVYVRAYDIGRIFFSLCVIVSVYNIQRMYFKTKDEVQRRKLRWVMLGLSAVPLVFIGLWQLPQTFIDQAWIQEEIVVLVSALIPVTFSISIVRYHLFNIDRIFSRATVYTIVIAVVLGIYIFIVGKAADFVGKQIAMSNILIPALAAIFIALIFEPLRRAVQTFVDRTYFRLQYDYREAMQLFTDEIKNEHDSSDIAVFIVQKIEALLPVTCICVFTTDHHGRNLREVIQQNMPDDISGFTLPRNVVQFTNGLQVFANEEDVEPGIKFRNISRHDLPSTASLLVTFPLENAERRWFLMIGRKKSETPFSIEDIDLIKSFVSHGSIMIDRILLQRKLILEQEHAHQLEELNRLKSFFVSSVSHDLKTPLTSIRMFAEMLQGKKKNISKSEEEYLAIIQGESERLARLIDNVLEFTKIERGIKEYRMSPIRLNALVKSVLKVFTYQFVLQEVTLKKSLYHKEIEITGDQDALVQVLTNLLANAIKYSPEKKHVTISSGVSADRAFIKISDKGTGIDQRDLKYIFKPFYRAPHTKIIQSEGAGLGLALVHHIVEAHGGTVEVESIRGKGSTFTIYLPQQNKLPHIPKRVR